MSENLSEYFPESYFPESMAPYDPALAEAIKGKEPQIKSKAEEVIRAAGVVQLPKGRVGPTALIMGEDTIIQAFSSSSKGTVFQIVIEIIGERSESIKKYYNIEDRELKIFYVKATEEGGEPVFLTFSNPVKAAVYQRLLAEKSSEGDDTYTADDFRKDEFRATPEKIRKLVEEYLGSQPRPDLADAHFEKLTNPRSRLPGGGQVKKLY